MPLRVALISYGAPGQAGLHEAIFQEKAGDLLAPVTVVAPNARAAVHLRHELARMAAAKGHGGLVNVSFTVLSRVAEALGASFFDSLSRRSLDRLLLGAAIRAELASHRGVLFRLGSHRSTEDELAARYVDLRDVDEDHLALLGNGAPLAQDLVILFKAVRSRLRTISYDDDDLCEMAAAHAFHSLQRDELGSVIVYLPDELRKSEVALLMALGESGNAVVHIGVLGDSRADRAGAELCDALLSKGAVEDVPQASEIISSLSARASPTCASGDRELFDTIYVAPDADAEVREGVGVLAERFESGARLERLALCYPTSTPYLRLCAHYLASARLPWSGPSPDPLAVLPSARFVSSLLSLVVTGITRRGFIELVSSSSVFDANGDVIPLDEWDRCSRLAGFSEGDVALFQARLAELRENALEELAGLEGDEGRDGECPHSSSVRREKRARRTISGCEGLSVFLSELGVTLRDLGRARTWADTSQICIAAFDRYVCANGSQSSGSDREITDSTLVVRVLEALGELDGHGAFGGAAGFADAFEFAVSRPSRRVGRAGSGIVVGSLESLVGLDLDCVVVLGCVEGNLPARSSASPLLSAADRERAGLGPMTSGAVAERDYRRLLIALAGAAERIATVPQFDSPARRVRIASRFLQRESARNFVPSFLTFLSRTAAGECFSPDETTRECAELLAIVRRGNDPVRHRIAVRSPVLADGLNVVRERRRKAFGIYSGLVRDAEMGHALSSEWLGPTTLEAYATCPMRFFFSHVLSCENLEEPERRWTIDARDKGLIAHKVLERFVALLIDSYRDGEGRHRDDGAILEAIMTEVTGRYERLGRTGKPILWALERRRLFSAIQTECERDERRRAQSGQRPIAVEYAFGYGEVEPVEIALGTHSLHFRGKIDRVDRTSDSKVVVIDYKTGNAASYSAMRKDPLDKGKRLQLPVYALAAREAFSERGAGNPVEALYRFVGGEEREFPFLLGDESEKNLKATLSVLASNIEKGCFPFHPGHSQADHHANCRSCDFDVICPVDRARFWESAREQDILADYVALIEGETHMDAQQ